MSMEKQLKIRLIRTMIQTFSYMVSGIGIKKEKSGDKT